MNRLNVTHCKALYVVIKTRICKNQSIYLQSSDEHSYWLVFALLYWLMFILLSGIFVDVEEFFLLFFGGERDSAKSHGQKTKRKKMRKES